MRVIVAMLFLAIWSTAYSAAPSNGPTVETKPQTARATSGRDDSDKQQTNVQRPPVVLEVIQAPDSTEERERKKNKAEEEASEYWSVLGHRLKITDSLLAFFTFVLVAVGFWQGVQLKLTVRAVDKEFISAHRPRIRIKHVWLVEPMSADTPIKVQVVSVNAGGVVAIIGKFDVVTCIVRKGQKTPANPFADREGNVILRNMRSGLTWDHGAQDAGLVTLDEIEKIRQGFAFLYCFAYIEYYDSLRPPTIMKTACCRVFVPERGGALSTINGEFRLPDEPSEHEYAD